MIDVHCHLNFHSFEKDFDEVIARALEQGVKTIINTGTQVGSSKRAVELAQQYKNLYAIIGIHPHHADKHEENWVEELKQLAVHPKVVGIGECGLDYYSYKSNGIVDPVLQKSIFIQQIKLAHELKLPLQIHNRQAGEDIITILKEHQSFLMDPPGMFHCFAGSQKVLQSALEMGFYIGFDGNITYLGLAPGENTALSDLAKATPIERIVTETDSPFLTPIPFKGSRNEPQYVIIVGQYIAHLKGLSFEAFQAQTVLNAQTVFNLK